MLIYVVLVQNGYFESAYESKYDAFHAARIYLDANLNSSVVEYNLKTGEQIELSIPERKQDV